MATSLANPTPIACPSVRMFDTACNTVRLGYMFGDVTILVVPANHQTNVSMVSHNAIIEEGKFDEGTARALIIEQRNTFATSSHVVLGVPSNMNLDISNQFRGHLRVWGRLEHTLTFALRHGASLKANGATMALGTVANDSRLIIDTVIGEVSIGANDGHAHLRHVGGSVFAYASGAGRIEIDQALSRVSVPSVSRGRVTINGQIYA